MHSMLSSMLAEISDIFTNHQMVVPSVLSTSELMFVVVVFVVVAERVTRSLSP